MANEERCVLCEEAITNPICPECLEREVLHWVVEQKASLVPILKGIGDSVKTFTQENISCIICRRNMNVCPHCYCMEIYSWLIENNYEDLASKFLQSFNFELDHKCKDERFFLNEIET